MFYYFDRMYIATFLKHLFNRWYFLVFVVSLLGEKVHVIQKSFDFWDFALGWISPQLHIACLKLNLEFFLYRNNNLYKMFCFFIFATFGKYSIPTSGHELYKYRIIYVIPILGQVTNFCEVHELSKFMILSCLGLICRS